MEDFELLHNGMKILQSGELFRLGTDSMLLADFCAPPGGRTTADLGCGVGALGILLCAQDEKCTVTGIEIQQAACALARQNITINQLDGRLRVLQGDLRKIRSLLPANGFDLVVSNPPYFPVGSGAAAQEEAFAIARTECCCTPADLCAAARWLLRFGGSFCIVHRPERMAELFCTLREHSLEPKRLRLVRHHPGADVSHILIDSRLGGRPGLRILPDLTLFDDSGAPTAEYRRIYHM